MKQVTFWAAFIVLFYIPAFAQEREEQIISVISEIERRIEACGASRYGYCANVADGNSAVRHFEESIEYFEESYRLLHEYENISQRLNRLNQSDPRSGSDLQERLQMDADRREAFEAGERASDNGWISFNQGKAAAERFLR